MSVKLSGSREDEYLGMIVIKQFEDDLIYYLFLIFSSSHREI
jgi:hypothetical protein